MAYEPRGLSLHCYSNGATLWQYKSPSDAIGMIDLAGYLNDASDMIQAGDMVLISAKDGGAMRYVAHVDPGVVLIEKMK